MDQVLVTIYFVGAPLCGVLAYLVMRSDDDPAVRAVVRNTPLLSLVLLLMALLWPAVLAGFLVQLVKGLRISGQLRFNRHGKGVKIRVQREPRTPAGQ